MRLESRVPTMPIIVPRPTLVLTLLAGVALPVRAQSNDSATACVNATGPDRMATSDTANSARPPAGESAPASGSPVLRILASVSAEEVRFVGSPRICVRLHGDASLDSARVTARRNLASPVVSGTTYRDVYVAVEILGHLQASCIAARITGTAPDSAASCASLQSKPSTTAPQSPPIDRPRR